MQIIDLSCSPCCSPCANCDPETLPSTATASVIINGVGVSVDLTLSINGGGVPTPNWYYFGDYDCGSSNNVSVFMGCSQNNMLAQVTQQCNFPDDAGLAFDTVWNVALNPLDNTDFTLNCDTLYFHWVAFDDEGESGGPDRSVTCCGFNFTVFGSNTLDLTIE